MLPCWRTWSLNSLSLENALPQCSHTRESVWKRMSGIITHSHILNKGSRVHLTYRLGLPEEVVEQLCVAGEHAATRRTGDQSLLRVAPHVFPEPIPDLEEGVAAWKPRDTLSEERQHEFTARFDLSPTCPAAVERLLLGNGLLLSTFHVVVHVPVEPLGVIKRALETNET